MDHINLEYLRSAKRLNPRMAHWALFFILFQFTVTYRPVDKNINADSLSLFHHVFRNYGFPEDIVSDRGPQFISSVWKAFLKLLGISVSLSFGYHPQTNGQTEQKIEEIGRYLRAYCHDNQHSWNHFLPWAEYAHNSLR